MALRGCAPITAHCPLPRRVALCCDFERLAGALGIAQLHVGAGLLAVQHRLQQRLLFGRHQRRQRGRGARRGRDHLALVLARRHIDDDEIAVLAQRGGADLSLERGQALGVVAPDEQRTDHLAGGIAQRLVMGHVLLAEQLRLAGERLALRQCGIGLALAIEQGADDTFVLLVAQRGGDAHEVIAAAGEDRGDAAGCLGKAVHCVEIEIQRLLAGAQRRGVLLADSDGAAAIEFARAGGEHVVEHAAQALGAFAQGDVVHRHRLLHQPGAGAQLGLDLRFAIASGLAVDGQGNRTSETAMTSVSSAESRVPTERRLKECMRNRPCPGEGVTDA